LRGRCGKRLGPIPLFSKCLTSWRREPRVEEPSTTGLLSFRRMGLIRVHPTFDPTTKLLSIRSIWTSIGRTLRLEGFKTLDPVRIDEPIKSPSRYEYQFHLSASCITQLQLKCQTTRQAAAVTTCENLLQLVVHGEQAGRSRSCSYSRVAPELRARFRSERHHAQAQMCGRVSRPARGEEPFDETLPEGPKPLA